MRASILACLLLFAAAPLSAQKYHEADEDWMDDCQESRGRGDRERYCELRETTMRATGRLLGVDARDNGGIIVRAWDGDEILIHARIQAQAESEEDARDLAKAIRVVAADDRIRADGPSTGRRESWSVTYEVHVPRRYDLNLETHNGPISVEGVTGRLEAEAVNGPMSLVNIGGDVRARTTNGPLTIRLDGTKWNGTGLDAETTNGPVTLSIPSDYSAHLETGTVNGPMSIDFPVTLQGRITRRMITTDLGSGGPTVRAVTTNGPVTVRRS